MTKPTDPAGEKFDEAASRTLGNYASCRNQIGLDSFAGSLLLCYGERDTSKSPIDDLHDKATATIRTAADTMAAERVREELNDFIDRSSRMKRTLVISRSSSHCGNCGADADPDEKRHDTKLGYGEHNGEPGCRHFWKYVTSDYTNMRERCLEMRPDLIWLGDELDRIKRRRAELAALEAKEEK